MVIAGVEVTTERLPLHRATELRWRFPKVRHVPCRYGELMVTDTVMEDSIDAVNLGAMVAHQIERAIASYPAWCERYLRKVGRKQARRVRMARKRRRGW